MRLRSVVSLVLWIVAVVATGAWLLAAFDGAAAREGVRALRPQLAELRALQRENARLRASQPSEAELAALRADRAALVRLRGELSVLRASIREQEKQLSPPAVTAGPWANVGRASPAAALETALWAGATNRVADLAQMLAYDARTEAMLTAAYGRLPESVRAQYGSPAQGIATWLAQHAPRGSLQIVSRTESGPDDTLLDVRLEAGDGTSKVSRFGFRRSEDGWRLVVPPAAVQGWERELTGTTAAR